MNWVATGSAMAVAGVLLLRHGWGRAERDPQLLGGAWGLLLLGLAAGILGHGAWGMAVVALFLMLAAFACLSVAAWTAPPDKARPAKIRHHEELEAGEPLHIGRRLITFLITVPLALIVSVILALAARVLVSGGGGAEADANVASLFLTPIVWAILTVLLLMAGRRRDQWIMLVIPAIAGGLCLIWGMGLTGGAA